MATVQTELVSTSGITPTANNASVGGDKVSPDSIIRIINGSGAQITMTMVNPQTVDGDLDVSDRNVPVDAGADKLVRASRAYRNPADGLVDLTWSATNLVTFEVIR